MNRSTRLVALMALALAALVATGCARQLTELIVVVDTDLRIPQDIDSVDIDVTGPAMGQPTHAHAALQGTGAVAMPVSLSLVPASTDRLTPVTIVVTGRLGSTAVVSRTVRTGFVLNQRHNVPVLLLRSCLGMMCGTGMTCTGRSCESANVDAASLPTFTGMVSGLDGGRRDACVPQTETCNGMDDDCDGIVDNGFDLQGDVANCGRCGNTCMLDHTTAAVCMAGTCQPMTCSSGYADCDGMPGNGCEQALDTLTHCGACRTACSRANATPSCSGGTCHIESCTTGFENCDGTDGNGCEIALDQLDHCGTCTATCMRDHATATCATRSCAIASCTAGFGNCDMDDATGCESPLDTPVNCHMCGTNCRYTNAVATCIATGCAMGACSAGFGNCDMLESTGCEQDLVSNTSHCGRCGHACATGVLCNGGVCENERLAALSAGLQFTCTRRTTSGDMFCWGANESGQLGDGTFSMRTLPTPVTGVTGVDAIGTGDQHTCIHRGGTMPAVLCWGDNASGQLGNGTRTSSATPVTATGLGTATQVAAGTTHSCARLSSGGVRCWGGNTAGQLGDGTFNDRTTPVAVLETLTTPITLASVVAAGQAHSCALLMNGSAECWGSNASGQLGDGTNTDHAMARPVMNVFNGTSIVAGDNHVCALLSTGSVMCWGSNAFGQLGDGTTTARNAPVAVSGLTNAVEIAAGAFHTCARTATGSVVCWGFNFSGQLGDGTSTDRNVPTAVTGLTNVATLAAGGSHTCALSTSSVVSCWGANGSGQLGTGATSPSQLTPVTVMNLP